MDARFTRDGDFAARSAQRGRAQRYGSIHHAWQSFDALENLLVEQLFTGCSFVPAVGGRRRGGVFCSGYPRVQHARWISTTKEDRKSTRLNSSHLVISYA